MDHGIHASATMLRSLLDRRADDGPDLLVLTKSVQALEITVCNQAAYSNNIATTQRTHAKLKKYTDFAEKTTFHVIPFVMSAFGHPASKTTGWARDVARHAITYGNTNRIIAAASIAVIRGNHDIVNLVSHQPDIIAACRGKRLCQPVCVPPSPSPDSPGGTPVL
jgi:hypothetical protein